jgi:hypothetical protein
LVVVYVWQANENGGAAKGRVRCVSPSLIRCLHAQRTQASEINREFVNVRGESVMPEKQVSFWCNELLTEGVVLLHSTVTCGHVSAAVQSVVVAEASILQPRLGPFRLSSVSTFKSAPHWKVFRLRWKVQYEVRRWLSDLCPDYYYKGMNNLISRWD